MVEVVQPLNNFDFDALMKRIAGYLYQTIQKLLLTTAEVRYSGISISRERKFGDFRMPDFLVPHPLEDIEGYDQTLIGALQSEIRVLEICETNDILILLGKRN